MDSSAPPAERSPSSETAPLSRATSRSKSPSSQRLVEEEDRTHASSSKPNGRSERGRKLPVSRKKSRTTTRRAVPRAVTPSDAATSDDDATNQLDTAQAKNTPTRHTSSPLSDYNDKSPSIPLASSSLRPNDAAPSSTHSTPAPAKTVTPAGSSDESDNSQGFSSKLAPRGRGRPKGRKFPNPKTTTRRPTASAPSSVGRNSPVADFLPTPRATRATVALPPGYIEGVKSTRMPRAVSVRAESSGIDEDVKPKKWIKGKEREVPKEIEVEEVVPEKMLLTVEVKNLPQLPAIVKSPETSPVSKRRKIEEDTAARNAATKQRLLGQLDHEAALINNATHPLIQHTYARLAVEKATRLSQLLDLREQTAMQIDRNLEVETEAVWRQWADAKDTLRMELYLANHDHLKQLISEEREYPFIRDHPLLVNSHGLPPTPYFRAPLPPPFPGESRRHDIRSTSHLDAPPYNRALDHSSWKLSPNEVEADLAIFAEFTASVPTSRSLSVTIEQPYGAVHYPPVLPTPPAVFQPPSAAVASSYFSQHSSAPRLPHDSIPANRPPTNIFPTPSSVAPRWSASGSGSPLEIPPRKNITTTHSHVQQGSLVLPSKPVHSNSNPGPRVSPAGPSISPGSGFRDPSYREVDQNYRARAVVPAQPATKGPESSNWFAHPRPTENRPRQESKSTLPHALASNQQQQQIPRTQGPSNPPAGPPKKPTESWMDWRPTPRTNNEIPAYVGKPSDNPRPPFSMYDRPAPPSNSSSSNSTTTSTSAFAAFTPQAIPLFNGGKGSRTPVLQPPGNKNVHRVG